MLYFWPKLWSSAGRLFIRGRRACWPYEAGSHEWILVEQVWGPIYREKTRFVDADHMFTLV